MTTDYTICLGTAGWGVWHSPDSGRSWTRHRRPFPLNTRIQALALHPTDPHTVVAAGDTGVFRSADAGAHWERVGQQGDLPTVWSLTIDPVDPQTLFAGTRPAGVYRSRDGGAHWTRLVIDLATECSIGTPFVTSVIVDPDDHRIVWAGVEIDGVFRSLDGGDTWTRTNEGLDDPSVLFAGCGETTTGETGHVLRTRDFGRTWETLKLPDRPNSTIWGFATHPADGNRVIAFSLFGEVFISGDAGDSWTKARRAFGEIRCAAWMPSRGAT